MGIPDHIICLLKNLYAGQEARVRTGHGMTEWFQISKGVHQGCILSLCLFNIYAEHIMRNAGLDEAQAGIKIVGRDINNLRYADKSEVIQLCLTLSYLMDCSVRGSSIHEIFQARVLEWAAIAFSAVILELLKKSLTVFIVSPSICHEVMGPDAMIFAF